jgi:hypothetical protein
MAGFLMACLSILPGKVGAKFKFVKWATFLLKGVDNRVTGYYIDGIAKRKTTMTKYFANSAATRKNRPLTSGFDTEAEARAHAEFLANTYGGVAKVSTNDPDSDFLIKYSANRGWH